MLSSSRGSTVAVELLEDIGELVFIVNAARSGAGTVVSLYDVDFVGVFSCKYA